MKDRLKLARKLVRIARSLMAYDFSEYEKERWWYAGDMTSMVVDSLRNRNTRNRGGGMQFYMEESRRHACVTCNLEVKDINGVITMTAFNFWESHYDDQNYGEWVENTVPTEELGLYGIAPASFTRTSDEDTAERLQAYAGMVKSRLSAAADLLEKIACPPFI